MTLRTKTLTAVAALTIFATGYSLAQEAETTEQPTEAQQPASDNASAAETSTATEEATPEESASEEPSAETQDAEATAEEPATDEAASDEATAEVPAVEEEAAEAEDADAASEEPTAEEAASDETTAEEPATEEEAAEEPAAEAEDADAASEEPAAEEAASDEATTAEEPTTVEEAAEEPAAEADGADAAAEEPAAEEAASDEATADEPAAEEEAAEEGESTEHADEGAEEGHAEAEGGGHGAGHIEDIDFSFEGPFGKYDQFQLQRGLQVYTEVCAACHGMKFVPIRTLHNDGGPGLPEDQVRAYAANMTIVDEETGEERPRLPTDHFPAVTGDGMGPDLSLMAKARAGFHGPYGTGINQLFKGIGGPEYIHAILTGYTGEEVEQAGTYLYVNTAYPTGSIGMPPPLSEDLVTYEDGTPATVDQMARDVSAFLMWTAEPKLTDRKQVGLVSVLFLIVLTALLYLTNKRLWAPHKGKKLDS
ncbi:cytochrome c1 [Paracoccus saliphilus]|uniref:Cytochrome c1 n=1 Tax=Paracoccus saliphilus TaxID=405559 RepID=A0AA45W0W3_9RHOB|nr:cytochrome c1 [Paracoccus saliphilus]WCR03358.1 cytochrome c1 [Paracoccus saliphilus]SIS52165.1 ubiquinol-cytochrome c reductase cytochrome c1 subunit [Paracoccus saliphilus]